MKNNQALLTADRLNKGSMIDHNGKWSVVQNIECTGYSFKIYHDGNITEIGLDDRIIAWKYVH